MKAILILSILFPLFAQAYAVETHGYLTKEIINFYNRHYPENKIAKELVDYLVDGSRHEDEAPRWLNHFYDPVHDRGLTAAFGSFAKAKDWAQNEKKQLAFQYNNHTASVLSLAQKDKVNDHLTARNFTWKKALAYWQKGEKEKAFYTLGHILHLLEDMAVPDHTRNDPHPQSSPYEDFSKNKKINENFLTNKKTFSLKSLDNYFDDLANYSNKNFYSADSINQKNYTKPQVDYFSKNGLFNFGFKKDDEFGNYKLVRKNNTSWVVVGDTIDDQKILQDYWSRLSTKSIQYGAGVLNLFFQEAKKLADKADKNDGKTAVDKQGLLTSLVNVVFSKTKNDGLKEVAVVSLDRKTDVGSQQSDKNLGTSDIQEINNLLPAGRPKIEPAANKIVCSFNSSSTPTLQNILINEVAWMGTLKSSNDEWLELKNTSPAEVNISGWWLIDKKEDVKINFPENSKIAAGGFYFLERTDDQTAPEINADLIYKGALSNDDEGLRLFDNNCQLVDEVFASPSWPAGNNLEKKTMERGSDLSWHDSSAGRTPKMENSLPMIIAGSGSAGGGLVSNSDPNPAASPDSPASITTTTSTANNVATQVKISEFLFDAEGSDEDKEFIELYNAGDQAVDLSQWSIQTSAAKKNFENGMKIQPQSFFLIWLGPSASSGQAPDMVWSSGSLNNSSSTIYLVRNQDKIENDNDPDVEDKISYSKAGLPAEAPLSGSKEGHSWERKALENSSCVSAQGNGEFLGNGCDTDQITDFDLRASPHPQNAKNLPEPRLALGAFNNLTGSYNPTDMTVTLSWSSTSTVFNVFEVNKDYDFTLKDFDSEGLPTTTTTTVRVPSFLKQIHWFKDPNSDDGFLDLTYDSYPILPPRQNAWDIFIFYKNSDPDLQEVLLGENGWLIHSSNFMSLRYPMYFGESNFQGLVLADNESLTGAGQGIMHRSYDYNYIEDNRLRIKASGAAGDYLTIAYYDFDPYSDGLLGQNFKLKAAEKHPYYFQEKPPTGLPPKLDGQITFDLIAPDLLNINLPKATDPDTRDKTLVYEIKINDQPAEIYRGEIYQTKAVPGEIYKITVRAQDEFGNFSEPMPAQWSYPQNSNLPAS